MVRIMQRQEERSFEDKDQPKLKIFCTQHAALQAFRLMGRLGKLLGPALQSFRGVKFRGQDIGTLAPMLATLFEQLDPDQAESLAINLMEGCLAVGVGSKAIPLNNAENIDLVFGGRLMTMFKVMAFAAEVNYKDFVGGLRDGGQASDSDDGKPAPANG